MGRLLGMGTVAPTSPLVLDEQITPSVRVRHWRQVGPCPRWSAVAHDAVEVAWVVRYRVGRRDHQVGGRRGFVVPHGHVHRTHIAPGTEAVSVWLERRLLLELEDTIGATRKLEASELEDPSLASLAGLMRDEARRRDAGNMVAVAALADAMGVKLLRHARTAERCPTRDPRIHRAIRMVEVPFLVLELVLVLVLELVLELVLVLVLVLVLELALVRGRGRGRGATLRACGG